jgi:CelD/BcsL family acetyltransferase involved in cellulose biosynthesis
VRAAYRLIGARDLDAKLVGVWRGIQAGSSAFESPYFCPEFTRAVGDVRDDVRVAVIENDGQPVGFFPHQRTLLGMGKPVGGPLSDFHGVIATPGSEWDPDTLVRAAGLSVWAFDHLVGDVHRFESRVTARAASPRIDLGAGYKCYVQDRRKAGSDYIPKTEGLARKLGREFGSLDFTLHDPAPAPLEHLFRWKSEQYRRSGITDGFDVPWTRALLRRICTVQTEEFAGVCSALRVNGRIVAVHMGMRSRQVLHYWFPAYDPAFAKFSTGIILLLRMAEAAAGAGLRTIDLGKGDAPYKQRLMTGAAELAEGAVELPSLLASARRLRRAAEARAARGGIGALLRLPLRAVRRLERTRRFS